MLKKIFESTLIMGTSSVMIMALDLVRVKILALTLGPQGIGTLSILAHFHTLAMTLVSLGLATGISKYVATYHSQYDPVAVNKVFASSFQVVFGFSLIIAIIAILTRSYLSKLLMGSSEYGNLVALYAVSLPLATYATSSSALLQGLKRVGGLARINFLRSLLSLAVIIPLVLWLGLAGAAVSVAIAALIQQGLNWRAVIKEPQRYRVMVLHAFDRSIVAQLFRYGATSLLVGSAFYLSHLLLKMIIVGHLGLTVNGIYQPIWALTMSYLTIVLSSMSTYSYPRLCELKRQEDVANELNGIIRISLLLIMPVMFFLLIARKPIILLLYNTDFLDATAYMPIQIVGDFFKVFSWSLGMYLLPTTRLKWFVIVNLLQDVLMVTLAWLWVDKYHLYGIAASFAVSYGVTSLLLVWYTRRAIGFRFWPDNLRLVIISGVMLSAAGIGVCMHSFWLKGAICAACVSLWGILSVKPEEFKQVLRYVKEKMLVRLRPRTSG